MSGTLELRQSRPRHRLPHPYGDLVIEEASLRVPHPEMLQRAFVLVPLREVAGDVRYPGRGETIVALAEKLGGKGVRLVAEAGWERASG